MPLSGSHTDGVTVIHASDVDQYTSLLTGGMTDQKVNLNGHKITFAPAGGSTDDGPTLQTLINDTPSTGTIEFQPGTYLINTSVTPKSGQTYKAAPGSVTLKRTVAGDIFAKTGAGALDHVSFIGLTFDMTATGWSAIDVVGSDAGGQITNLLIRDCYFKNPSITWMIQVSYTILDPVVPTLKNANIRIEDCYDDATGGTFTLENWIFVNCQDVYVSGCRMLNTPATLAAHVAVYGYCRNVRFLGNYIENWASSRAVYVVQSDSVSFVGDQFRTTLSLTCIEVFNSKDVKMLGCQLITGNAGVGVTVHDFSGATFDGHTNQYTSSSGIALQDCRIDGLTTCFQLNVDQVQGQTDILVSGNLVSPLRSLFIIQGMPASPSAAVKRIKISNNHVATHSGFSGGAALIELGGNASATLGGISGVQISDNFFAASAAGGSGTDVEVTGLADDIAIMNNRHLGSATPLVLVSGISKLKVFGNPGADGGIGGIRIVAAPAPSTGQTAAVASVAALTVPNDGNFHTYRVSGCITITTLGSGSINLQVVYTDNGGTSRTRSIPLTPVASPTPAAAATTADDWVGSVLISAFPNIAVTLKTAGTFTGCTYNVTGQIEQIL